MNVRTKNILIWLTLQVVSCTIGMTVMKVWFHLFNPIGFLLGFWGTALITFTIFYKKRHFNN